MNSKILSLILAVTFATLFHSELWAKTKTMTKYTGTTISCHDGDTCRVLVNGKQMKVRFAGIDAPEIKQPEGKMAKAKLDELIYQKPVNLECEGKSFDRTTCTVFLDGKNINEEMVRTGFAWDSPRYSKGRYQQLMLTAQKQKIGIWKTTTISPYCFRHSKNSKCRVSSLWMDSYRN